MPHMHNQAWHHRAQVADSMPKMGSLLEKGMGGSLWHSVYLRKEYKCSYYNMKMIRWGVLTWGQYQYLMMRGL